MKAALYARVSTTHGQDVNLQLRELRQFAEARGWEITGEYVDSGVSGAKDSRPALDRLMSDAKRRKCDVILVWKLDRFGRSLRHLVNALAELEAVGVSFVSLTDNLDLSTPTGRLMFQVIAAMSEFERELIRERVRAGLRNARAKGRKLGRPRAALDAARIGRLRAQGRSLREIAGELGCSASLVHKTLAKLSPNRARIAAN
jgi:DNA invertase Pin-like site-specific DNA recombinase